MPKISVIMLTYNREQLVSRAIESILAQTFQNFEFIIVLNGCIDDTKAVVEQYAKKDSRIHVIHKEKGNIGSGRNAGLDVAVGEYIAFIDDDDWCEPDFLEFLYDLAQDYQADIAICGARDRTFDEKCIYSAEEAVITLLWRKRFNVQFPTKLIRHKLFDNVRFSITAKYDDIELMPQILASANRVAFHGLPKYTFLRHDGNVSIWTTNYYLLDHATLEEYLQVYRHRTEFLCRCFPMNKAIWQYFEWSFWISMLEKIICFSHTDCYDIANQLQCSLASVCGEFMDSNYSLNFEREWMDKYIMFPNQEIFIRQVLSLQSNKALEWIDIIRKSDKHLYIFAAGAAGKLIKTNLEQHGLTPFCFVDNDKNKVGTVIDELLCVSCEEMLADEHKYIVIGTVAFHYEIVEDLLKRGVRQDEICFADFLHLDDVVAEYFLNHIKSILQVFSKCADEESRQLFVGNLLYQFNRDRSVYQEWNLPLSPLEQQYYEPSIITSNGSEVYMDCGAKDGDTAIAFHKFTNGEYKKIFTFEPDCTNFEILSRNTEQYSDVVNINAGVGEHDEILAFDGGRGGHSSFGKNGSTQVQIIPLDQYLSEKPTFIKMDIEGFELNALKGSKQIIRNLKPQMAICVYHKPRDIVELPAYVLSLRDDYKIYYRQYRGFGHDLVCYFV